MTNGAKKEEAIVSAAAPSGGRRQVPQMSLAAELSLSASPPDTLRVSWEERRGSMGGRPRKGPCGVHTSTVVQPFGMGPG